MEMALNDIARLVEGQIVGDPTLVIHGINSVEDAQCGEITFISSPLYSKKATATNASAIVSKSIIKGVQKTFLLVENPRYALAQILCLFQPPRHAPPAIDRRAALGQHLTLGQEVTIGAYAIIQDYVKIGNHVMIDPGVYIGEGSEIGDLSHLYPNVTVCERVQIGKRVIIHSGTVIGADGFGFTSYQGRHVKIPQVGTVTIEDDVELGANVTVDRATLGQTIIGQGTKIANQVHIGHNVKIGPHTLIVAQTGIAGSVKIGHHVTLAGQVGILDHAEVGDYAVVGTRSIVTNDIRPNERVSGFPALPHKKWLAAQVSISYLPALRDTVRALDKKIKEMDKKLDAVRVKIKNVE